MVLGVGSWKGSCGVIRQIFRRWGDFRRSEATMGPCSPARLSQFLLSALAVGLMALTAMTGVSSQATAQGAVKSVHNDWQVRCDTPPGAQGEQCALIQSVT